jgi:cell division protein FtsI/penicillin-binding protein 2
MIKPFLILNLMKTTALFLLSLAVVSCLKLNDNGSYIMTTGRVEITQTDIPETATINQVTEIKAIAEESNNCWSNLNFELTQNSDFDYTLEAFGLFESYGSCGAAKVTGDTTIAFKPIQTGIYKFHIVKSETETALDSMIVVNEIK